MQENEVLSEMILDDLLLDTAHEFRRCLFLGCTSELWKVQSLASLTRIRVDKSWQTHIVTEDILSNEC